MTDRRDSGNTSEAVGPRHCLNIFVSQLPLLYMGLIIVLYPSQGTVSPGRLNEIMKAKASYRGCRICSPSVNLQAGGFRRQVETAWAWRELLSFDGLWPASCGAGAGHQISARSSSGRGVCHPAWSFTSQPQRGLSRFCLLLRPSHSETLRRKEKNLPSQVLWAPTGSPPAVKTRMYLSSAQF